MSTVEPAQAAQAVLKAAVETYHEILLGLRMRELAKAEKEGTDMKLTDLIKSQAIKAPKANGGQIVAKEEAGDAKCGNCGRPGPDRNGKCPSCARGIAKEEPSAKGPSGVGIAKGPVPSIPSSSPGVGQPVIGKPPAEMNPAAPGSNPSVMGDGKQMPAFNQGTLGGKIAVGQSIWKRETSMAKGSVEVRGVKARNGGRIKLGKQEFFIDVKNANDSEKRLKDPTPVKGTKTPFDGKPESQDRAGEGKASGGDISKGKGMKKSGDGLHETSAERSSGYADTGDAECPSCGRACNMDADNSCKCKGCGHAFSKSMKKAAAPMSAPKASGGAIKRGKALIKAGVSMAAPKAPTAAGAAAPKAPKVGGAPAGSSAPKPPAAATPKKPF